MLTEKRYIEESVAADFSGRLRPSRDGDEGISLISEMEGRSWTEVWGQILNSQPPDYETTDLDLNEWQDSNFFAQIDDNAESWAQNILAQQPELQPPDASVTYSVESQSLEVEQDVCFGMIHRTPARICGDMQLVRNKLDCSAVMEGSTSLCEFNLLSSSNSESLDFAFSDGTLVGSINELVSKILKDLLKNTLIRFQPFADKQKVTNTIDRAKKESDATVYVSIHIFGPRSMAEVVGDHLSKGRIWLQRPDLPQALGAYHNPHNITFEAIESSLILSDARPKGNTSSNSKAQDSIESLKTDVYSALKKSAEDVERLKGDSRLKSELLDYQQQALFFMVQREQGPIPESMSLWKRIIENGQEKFQHTITQEKSKIRVEETGGGIIADEMGMGKTLSALSLIVRTLEDAAAWSAASDGSQDRRRATLVLLPSAILINNWINEINIHLDGTIKVIRYHGERRKGLLREIETADVVLTTYHTLLWEFESKKSPLHNLTWFRLVLDEAHTIRRQATKFYRAASELSAVNRWCLTGTPIQNKLEDVGTLFAFIRLKPFHNLANFRRYISSMIEESEAHRQMCTRRLISLLQSCSLRRTKELLHLPDIKDITRLVELSDWEWKQYNTSKDSMNRKLRITVDEKSALSRFGMFQIQLQLRILCNHGTWQHLFHWARGNRLDEQEDAFASIDYSGEVKCSACRQLVPLMDTNSVYNRSQSNCAHNLCSDCLNAYEPTSRDKSIQQCPQCLASGIITESPGSIPSSQETTAENYFQQSGQSSKMDALISDLGVDIETTTSVVFSCWTHTLDLIARYCRESGFDFRRIDGNTPVNERQTILNEFKSRNCAPILLMTTGTGALGINLTFANRVFLVEPQWNPSVENQAVARALRLGQGQKVSIIRYIAKDTVEQEMRAQQRRKENFAKIGELASQNTANHDPSQHTLADTL